MKFLAQKLSTCWALNQFMSVQSLTCVWLFAAPWTAACQTALSITNSWSLLKLMSIESVMPFNHLILCHSLLLPSVFPSIRVFSNESVLRIRWPKYWSFSFNISPSNEYSGLISLGLTGLISLKSKGFSRVSSSTIVWKHQFFSTQLSLLSNFLCCCCPTLVSIHGCWKNHSFNKADFGHQSDVSAFEFTI